MSLVAAALQRVKHAVAYAAAATMQVFHAHITVSVREETSVVVLSPLMQMNIEDYE